MKKFPFILLAALATLLLMTAAAVYPAGDAALNETYWRATAIDGTPVIPQPEKRQAHLVFRQEGSRVSGSTGCNLITGTFSDTAPGLHFSQMAATKMMCAPPLDAQERAFLGAINATAARQLTGNVLELKDADGRVRLRFEAAAPPAGST